LFAQESHGAPPFECGVLKTKKAGGFFVCPRLLLRLVVDQIRSAHLGQTGIIKKIPVKVDASAGGEICHLSVPES
jgi:hypothetical protein